MARNHAVYKRRGAEISRVASHSFTGGFAGIGKLPALFGWYIRYGIGIKVGLTNAETT